jgi:hypothetical protein
MCALLVAVSTVLVVGAHPALGAGASQFSGVLIDATGAPQPGATVTLTDGSGNSYPATTASDGSFSLVVNSASYQVSVAGPGAFNVNHSASGDPDSYVLNGSVDLSGGSVTGQTLTLPTFATVSVTDPSATPIAGASVSVVMGYSNPNTCSIASFALSPTLQVTGTYTGMTQNTSGASITRQTDATGTAVFPGFHCEGKMVGILASAPGFEEGSASYPTSGTSVAIQLTPIPQPVTFAGITKNQAGIAQSGVRVSLFSAPSGGPPVATTITASDGSFSMSLSPGSYYVFERESFTTSTSGGQLQAMSTVPIDLSTSLSGQTLTLPTTEPIDVNVQDSSGHPLNDMGVSYGSHGDCLTTSYQILPGVSTEDQSYFDSMAVTGASGMLTFTVPQCSSIPPASSEFLVEPPTGSSYATEYVNGPSSVTGPTSVTLTVLSLPGPPQGFSAAPGTSSISLQWGAPKSDGGFPITSYTITASSFASASSLSSASSTIQANGISRASTTKIVGPTTHSTVLTGLAAGRYYWVTITAQTQVGSSKAVATASIALSNAASFTVVATTPVGVTKQPLTVFVLGAPLGARVRIEVGAVTTACIADRSGRCSATVRPSAVGATTLKAQYGIGASKHTARAVGKFYVAKVHGSVHIAKGARESISIRSGVPSSLMTITDGQLTASTKLSRTGSGSTSIKEAAKGTVVFSVVDDGVLLEQIHVTVQ